MLWTVDNVKFGKLRIREDIGIFYEGKYFFSVSLIFAEITEKI